MWVILDVAADPTAPMAAKWPDGFIANIADVCVEDYRNKNRSGNSEASQPVVKDEQPLPGRKSNKDETKHCQRSQESCPMVHRSVLAYAAPRQTTLLYRLVMTNGVRS